MDEAEFDVLDELYFVISYENLVARLDLEEKELVDVLLKLVNKGWIRVFENPNDEIDQFDLKSDYRSYYFLASKKGLFAHNR